MFPVVASLSAHLPARLGVPKWQDWALSLVIDAPAPSVDTDSTMLPEALYSAWALTFRFKALMS